MRLLPRKHILQYDWLVHLFAAMSLLFPLLFLLSESTANPWQLTLICPLFLILWYYGFWQERRWLVLHFLTLIALATWAMSMHWSGALFFFYSQVFLLRFNNVWLALLSLMVLAAWVLVWAIIWRFPSVFSIVFPLLIVLGGQANVLFFRHINAQRELLMQQDELEYLSRARERERIARDLHDVLGHSLSTIALKAELSEKLLSSGATEKAGQELSDIAETARTALADIRQTVTGYRSGNIRSEATMAKHALTNAGISADFPEQFPQKISREIENLMSLLLREAIANVIRHANASLCRVQFFHRQRQWHLIVTDDGLGWNGHYGNGLTGMKERLAVYGGQLQLTRQETGTRLQATVEPILEGIADERH